MDIHETDEAFYLAYTKQEIWNKNGKTNSWRPKQKYKEKEKPIQRDEIVKENNKTVTAIA